MQKVEGSSPFSRLEKARKCGPLSFFDRDGSVMSPETVSQTRSFTRVVRNAAAVRAGPEPASGPVPFTRGRS
jgi:hypothetical protein